MDEQQEPKWYFKTWSLVVSFLCAGPLMLPLVWTNPRFNRKVKIIVTLAVVAATFFMTLFLAKFMEKIYQQYYLMPGAL